MNYEEIEKDIKNILSEKRFKHSVGVAKRAVELAKIYKENEEEAKLIGIAHDIAKEMPKDESLKYIKENGIILDEIEELEPSLWHSKIGAHMVIKRYGFTPKMAQSILYHTTGNVNMNTMDKIIYIADKTEENRTYDGIEEGIKISNENLDNGIYFASKRAIVYSLNKKSLIHQDTIDVINKIIKESNNNKLN